MLTKELISLNSPKLQYIGVSLKNPHHTVIPTGTTVVTGPNGAGKSVLGKILEKGWNITTNDIKSPVDGLKVKYMEFNDIHSLAGFKVEYYQQRFESSMNDDVPTVAELLGKNVESETWKMAEKRLNISDILDKKVNFLSSGELRKLLITNMMFDLPQFLILDNPFIGLDAASRDTLNEELKQISDRGISIMLLICDPNEIPDYTDTVIPIKDLTIGEAIHCGSTPMENIRQNVASLFDFAVNIDGIPTPATKQQSESDDTRHAVFELNKCNVKYGTRVILRDVCWTVKQGECWALAGRNGSGKSTLLSLIYADNPQVYSNEVKIFGSRRGTGESIWDIKKRIGYVSPEMHLYFGGGANRLIDVVSGGLNDTVGCFRQITPQQEQRGLRWLKLLHMEHLAQQRFNVLSAGQQRLALLARTFIKSPELLILDEPMHGLDIARKKAVRAIINTYARRDHTTIIYVTHHKSEVPECISHTKTLP